MRTVYVLGAGASAGYQGSYIGETSPVAKNFFHKAARVMSIHNINGKKFDDSHITYRNLFDFIKKLWGIDPINLGSTNFDLDMEEVLTLLHIELEENPESNTHR